MKTPDTIILETSTVSEKIFITKTAINISYLGKWSLQYADRKDEISCDLKSSVSFPLPSSLRESSFACLANSLLLFSTVNLTSSQLKANCAKLQFSGFYLPDQETEYDLEKEVKNSE